MNPVPIIVPCHRVWPPEESWADSRVGSTINACCLDVEQMAATI